MPTITFTVNLENPNYLAASQPYTISEADNFRTTRSTFFPDFLRNNRNLKHGDTITLEGMQAVYCRDNFTSGEFKFLDITG